MARHVVRPVAGRIPPGGGTSDSMPGVAMRIDALKNRRQEINADGIDKTEGTLFESASNDEVTV
jgi:hypothetical protein